MDLVALLKSSSVLELRKKLKKAQIRTRRLLLWTSSMLVLQKIWLLVKLFKSFGFGPRVVYPELNLCLDNYGYQVVYPR